MSQDWSWFDDFKSGDNDAFSRSLAEETDRSLAKDPGRWSWASSDDLDEHRPGGRRGGHVADQRHHSGKGHVEKGESGERTQAFDYDAARRDYERQNPRSWWDGERDDDRDQGRGWFR